MFKFERDAESEIIRCTQSYRTVKFSKYNYMAHKYVLHSKSLSTF